MRELGVGGLTDRGQDLQWTVFRYAVQPPECCGPDLDREESEHARHSPTGCGWQGRPSEEGRFLILGGRQVRDSAQRVVLGRKNYRAALRPKALRKEVAQKP